MRTKIVVPFLGILSSFNRFSLQTLLDAVSRQEVVEIILIFDRDPGLQCAWLHIENVFKHDNVLGLKLDDLKKFPYKLCDLRPVYDLIFPIEDFEYIAWCDLDVIYGKKISNNLSPLLNGAGGLGHFTCISFDVYKKFQKVLLSDKRDLFNASKNYALDEHRFFHQFLKDEELVLEKLDLIDVDPRRKYCTDYDGRVVSEVILEDDGRLICIYMQGNSKELSYIHFQKRKINIKKATLDGRQIHLVKDKKITIDAIDEPTFIRCLKFYLSRIKYHIKNGSLIQRQSLR